jgi:hypothetical protein
MGLDIIAVLGSRSCLRTSLNTLQAIKDLPTAGTRRTIFMARYDEWAKAFELAADDGAVVFCRRN